MKTSQSVPRSVDEIRPASCARHTRGADRLHRTGRRDRTRLGNDGGLGFKEVEEILHVEGLLADVVQRREQAFDDVARPRERGGQERQFPYGQSSGQCPDEDPYIGTIVSGQREKAE